MQLSWYFLFRLFLFLEGTCLPHSLSLFVTILEAMLIEYFYFPNSFLAIEHRSSGSLIFFSLALTNNFFSLSVASSISKYTYLAKMLLIISLSPPQSPLSFVTGVYSSWRLWDMTGRSPKVSQRLILSLQQTNCLGLFPSGTPSWESKFHSTSLIIDLILHLVSPWIFSGGYWKVHS